MARAVAAQHLQRSGSTPLTPIDATLRAIGIRDDADPGDAEVWLWPCNVQAWQCWCDLQTQWRVGMGGATGLDYTAALALLRTVHGLRGQDLRDTFDALRAAELAVLELWAQQRH